MTPNLYPTPGAGDSAPTPKSHLGDLFFQCPKCECSYRFSDFTPLHDRHAFLSLKYIDYECPCGHIAFTITIPR